MSSKDKKKQTYFDKTWLEHEEFLRWVAEVKNEPTKCRCKICHKTNGLSNIGNGTLKIHLKGTSHEANAKKVKNSFRCSMSPTVGEVEIQWTLKSVIAGYSNNSNADRNRLFLSMFSDSNITKKYHLGADKMRHSANFELVPYFKNILMESISKSAPFVISFDESLNKATPSCNTFLCWKWKLVQVVSHRYS